METLYIVLIACLLGFFINYSVSVGCAEHEQEDCNLGATIINFVIFAVAGYFVYQNMSKSQMV